MKFINFAIVKFSGLLMAGILSAHFFPLPFSFIKILAPCLLLLLVFWLIARQQLFQNTYFGIVAYICFFGLGHYSYQLRLPTFQATHYSHFTSKDSSEILQLKITRLLKPDKYNSKYLTTIEAINGVAAEGTILLNISKDSINTQFLPDDILLASGKITSNPKPLNPHQFDYSKYMKSLGVYGQLRISKKQILQTTNGTLSLLGVSEKLRQHIIKKLKQVQLNTDERTIIQALILGEKRELDPQLYTDYARAGAVHILAVSGLHVGILYLILGFLLKPLKRIAVGRYIQPIIIVLLLWGFALLSGLSPSVSRAVTMFSFFAFASLLNRSTNSINTLFLSFFTLLVINPLWLFQVGFQLSYLAVFFILWLLPQFYKLWFPKNFFLRKAWGIFAVTISAQLGVVPLSLFYFHQFPGLFLLTNFVILPSLTVLMLGGITIVLLATFNLLPDRISIFYNYLIESLNNFIRWVAKQDEFLFSDIHFSLWKVIGSYLLLITLLNFLKQASYKKLIATLISVCLLVVIFIWDNFQNSNSELVIFQKSKTTLLGYKKGRKLILFRNDSIKNYKDSYPVKAYRIATNIKTFSEERLSKVFAYKEKHILIIDSMNVYPSSKNIETILLTQSPKLNLNRLIDSLNPKLIIADGSNYYSYVEKWKETCKLKKLPLYHTGQTGAFLLE